MFLAKQESDIIISRTKKESMILKKKKLIETLYLHLFCTMKLTKIQFEIKNSV